MENSTTLYDKRMSHFVGLGLVFGFLLPHTYTAFLIVNPLLCLVYQFFKQNRGMFRWNILVVSVLLISLVLNINQDIAQKSLLSFITICLYFICFPIVKNVKVYNGYIYFILAIIILSQFAYLLKIPFITNLLDTYYPFPDLLADQYVYMRNHIGWNNIFDYRLDGLYRNPNQCAYYLTCLLAFYLIASEKKGIQNSFFVIIIVLLSVLFTGSRTGFLISALIIIASVFLNKSTPKAWKILSTIVIIIMGIYVVVNAGLSSYRAFDIGSGRDDSLSSKMNVLMYYLSQEKSIIKILFGYLDPNRFVSDTVVVMSKFDADIGYLIFQYGFTGLFVILFYFHSIYKRVNKIGHVYFILLLWIITSSIVTSYRAFFVFMLELSMIYSNSRSPQVK